MNGIPVGRRFEKLHLLAGAEYSVAPTTGWATLVVPQLLASRITTPFASTCGPATAEAEASNTSNTAFIGVQSTLVGTRTCQENATRHLNREQAHVFCR